MSTGPCSGSLANIPGTGNNNVLVPGDAYPNGQYNNAADKLLYEIWQTLLLILAANPPAMAKVITFTVGDGQANTPAAGTNSLVIAAFGGVPMGNTEWIVLRNGIQLLYSNAITHNDILRKNTGATGGFQFDAAGSNFTFQNGEKYQLFATGINSTIE